MITLSFQLVHEMISKSKSLMKDSKQKSLGITFTSSKNPLRKANGKENLLIKNE
jgi:hypothetical protein